MKEQGRQGWCPDCDVDLGRRRFIAGVGAVAVAGMAGVPAVAANRVPKGAKVGPAEPNVKRLFETLTAEQRAVAALPFSDERLLRAGANWHVIKPTIGELYNAEQQGIIHEIVRGLTSEDGYERFLRQMEEDSGGFDRYSCAIFGTPGQGPSAFLMTGRHLTLRAEGNAVPDSVFGGPIIYGHGVEGNPRANLFNYQTRAANAVFQALDGAQREKALLTQAPAENSIQLKKQGFAGIAVGELSKDQRTLVEKVMRELLAPYREADVHEAMSALKQNGGLEKVHLSFYRNDDILNDQEWDIWRLDGPTLVWHFRGAPHVHTWVNFKTRPA